MESTSETVLLIEDDLKLAKLFTEALEAAQIRCCSTLGANAMQAAAARQPDLILLHTGYALEGLDILAKLRHYNRTSAIPVVVLSGNTERRVIDRLHAQGADDYWALHEIAQGALGQHVRGWFATHPRAAVTAVR